MRSRAIIIIAFEGGKFAHVVIDQNYNREVQQLGDYNKNMGNSGARRDENAQFLKAVKQMNNEQNSKSPTLVSTNLDKKYRTHLLQEIYKVQIPKLYKKMLGELIQENISKEDLTAAVALFTALKSNQMTSSILKIKVSDTPNQQVTGNVIVKFDERMLRKRKPKTDLTTSHFSSGHFEETQHGRVKYTASVISKQINKPYHPFRILCQKFGDALKIDEILQSVSSSEEDYEMKEKYIQKITTQFCKFLVQGCIGLYKKWIMGYTGVQEKKYEKWMTSIAINQMWAVSENSLRDSIFQVIDKIKVPLKLHVESIQKASLHLLPEDFAIDAELQIQGHYFKSIYQLSELTIQPKPTELVKHLETIKNCICVDVDQYHKLAEKGQVYEINGDNIMGIVAYILCKIASKIDQIYTVLLFLKLVYGDIIFYGLDVGSYMYSTLTGAIQYLESKDFQTKSLQSKGQYVSNKQEEQSQEKGEEYLKDTGCSSVILDKC